MLLCWFRDDAAPAGAEMKACSASLQKPAWAFWETSLVQICSLLLLAVTTETSQDDQSYGNTTCQTWWKVCSSQNRHWNNPSLPNFLSHVQYRSEDLVCCRLTLLHWYNLEKAGGHSHQQPSPYFKLKPQVHFASEAFLYLQPLLQASYQLGQDAQQNVPQPWHATIILPVLFGNCD